MSQVEQCALFILEIAAIWVSECLLAQQLMMLGWDKGIVYHSRVLPKQGQESFHADTPLLQQRAGNIPSSSYRNISSRCLPNLFLEVSVNLGFIICQSLPLYGCSFCSKPLFPALLAFDSSAPYSSGDLFLTPSKRWEKQVVSPSCQ